MSVQNNEARIAVLEANYQHLTNLQQKSHDTIIERLEKLEDVVLQHIEKLDHAVNGNGKKGLIERVGEVERDLLAQTKEKWLSRLEAIEKRHSEEEGQQKAADKLFDRIKPFIPYILMILWISLMYAVKR